MSTPPTLDPPMVDTAITSTHEYELNMSDAEVKEENQAKSEKRLHPEDMDQSEEFIPQKQLDKDESTRNGNVLSHTQEKVAYSSSAPASEDPYLPFVSFKQGSAPSMRSKSWMKVQTSAAPGSGTSTQFCIAT